MNDIEKNDLTRIYKKYCKKEFEDFKNGLYPVRDFFGYGSSITWCPVCEKQVYVTFVSFSWCYHEKCNCTFFKEYE